MSWKSTLTVSLNACFKLKLKDRSFKDPDLGTRLAYMVEDRTYVLDLSKFPKDPPPEEVRWPAFICVTIINICQGHSTLSSQCVFGGAQLTQLVQLVTASRLFLGHEGQVDL